MGCQVNARDGVLVLQRALVNWGKRSKNYDRVLQNFYDVLEIQNDLIERKSER